MDEDETDDFDDLDDLFGVHPIARRVDSVVGSLLDKITRKVSPPIVAVVTENDAFYNRMKRVFVNTERFELSSERIKDREVYVPLAPVILIDRDCSNTVQALEYAGTVNQHFPIPRTFALGSLDSSDRDLEAVREFLVTRTLVSMYSFPFCFHHSEVQAGNKNGIVIFTGTTGSGKTTLLKEYVSAVPETRVPIKLTGRPKRNGENDGEEYQFVTDGEVRVRTERGEVIGYQYDGHWYGLPVRSLDVLEEGKDVALAMNPASVPEFMNHPAISALKYVVHSVALWRLPEEVEASIRARDGSDARIKKFREEFSWMSDNFHRFAQNFVTYYYVPGLQAVKKDYPDKLVFRVSNHRPIDDVRDMEAMTLLGHDTKNFFGEVTQRDIRDFGPNEVFHYR